MCHTSPPSHNISSTTSIVIALGCIAVLPVIAMAGGNEPPKLAPTPRIAPIVSLVLPKLETNGLLLENQEVVGWNVPNRLLVDREGGGFFLGLTQTNGRFSAVLPGTIEEPQSITESLRIAACPEVVSSPPSLKITPFTQFIVLNTTDGREIFDARPSGSLTLSDSVASASAISNDVPPDNARYIVYFYATEAGSIRGSCLQGDVSSFISSLSIKIDLRPGWNAIEFSILKQDAIHNMYLSNASSTDGFKWYFTKK
jgi:hypothetical protein